jgi:hypothetical protein
MEPVISAFNNRGKKRETAIPQARTFDSERRFMKHLQQFLGTDPRA